jgi:Ca-activated chloride channel family protein
VNAKRDYYALLGILRDASPEDIRRAYVEAAQRLHPDKNQAPGETEFFLEIQQAYETLSNPKRREEYDETLPPADSPSSPIVPEILYSRPHLVRMQEAQLVYVLLNMKTRGADALPVPPLNICLALDRSTSMKGAKMELLKAASIQVMRGLRDEDIFSVVVFGDNAEVAIPASYRAERQKLEARIRDIQVGGATEMLRGLESGLNELRRGSDSRRINHLILLTDGQTYGDEQACLDLASQAAREGIGISAMGIGADWNDSFLDQVASRTGNTSRYIARPQDIQKLLTEKFNALANVVAEDISLEGKLGEAVKLNYAFRLQPEAGPVTFGAITQLGPVLRDVNLSVLFEFHVSPAATSTGRVDLLNGSLKIAMAARPIPLPPIRVRIGCDVLEAPSAQPPPTAILQALSRLTLYRMQERARHESQAGQYDRATRSLQNLAAHLLSQGHHDLANTILLEADNVQRMHTFSLTGEKDIKYATRALIMQQDEALL